MTSYPNRGEGQRVDIDRRGIQELHGVVERSWCSDELDRCHADLIRSRLDRGYREPKPARVDRDPSGTDGGPFAFGANIAVGNE